MLNRNATFTQEDCDKLENLSYSVGRAHEIVNKIEQLHIMPKFSNELLEKTMVLQTLADKNANEYEKIAEQMNEFTEEVGRNEHLMKNTSY